MAVVLAALPLLFDNVTIFGITFDQFWVGVFAQGIALAIIYLSYTLVTGEGGMISLCQITLAGIGAFAAARLAAEAGWPVWLAILVGAVFAVPFGLLVALPSLRIGDLYLALLTIGFALLVEQFVWTRNEYENFGAGVQIARPFGIGITDRLEMYAIVAVVFAVVAFAIVNLKRATSGLVFAAIRSSEPAATTSGMSIVRVKLVLFGVSAFVAGLGGGLYATVVGTALPKSFNALVGIVWLAIVVTWGVRSVVGALLAGMIFAIAPQRLSIILVLVFFLVVSGVITRLALGRAYRNVLGALAMLVLAVVAVGGSVWIWDNVSSDDAVKVILVALGLAAALLVGTAGREGSRSPANRCGSPCSWSSPASGCGWRSPSAASTSARTAPARCRPCCSGSGPSASSTSRVASSTTSSTANDSASSNRTRNATRNDSSPPTPRSRGAPA